MRKTFHKKRNRKTKKQMKGGIGDLGEHVFIGYKFIMNDGGLQTHMPILVPKNFPIAKKDKNYSYLLSDQLDYSCGLHDVINRYFGPFTNSKSIDNQRNITMKYDVYLPYLNKLTNIGRINIYDLINKGMKLMDEDNMMLNMMIGLAKNSYGQYDLENLKKYSKEQDKYVSYIDNNMRGHVFQEILDPLMENIHYKKLMKEAKEAKDELTEEYYKKIYDGTVIQIDELFKQYPLLKELIQDLECRYPAIIEPILLTDEVSIYNYANGPEPSASERVERASRVLEEGMKKI